MTLRGRVGPGPDRDPRGPAGPVSLKINTRHTLDPTNGSRNVFFLSCSVLYFSAHICMFGVLVKDGLARRHRLFMTRGRLHHADSSGEGGEGREGREGREGGEKGEKGEEREEREEGEEGEEA